MVNAFKTKYPGSEGDSDFEQPWRALQFAVSTDRRKLQKDNEVFSEAIAFLGEGLFSTTDKTWRIDSPHLYLDVFRRDSSRQDLLASLDLALMIGEAIERGEFVSVIEYYKLFLSDWIESR